MSLPGTAGSTLVLFNFLLPFFFFACLFVGFLLFGFSCLVGFFVVRLQLSGWFFVAVRLGVCVFCVLFLLGFSFSFLNLKCTSRGVTAWGCRKHLGPLGLFCVCVCNSTALCAGRELGLILPPSDLWCWAWMDFSLGKTPERSSPAPPAQPLSSGSSSRAPFLGRCLRGVSVAPV